MRTLFNRASALGYGASRWLRKALFVGALALPMGTAQAETVTIAALGDSLTAGYGLPVPDGLVPQLEGWLRDHGRDVQVRNAGVSGDTTAGGLSRVDWTLTPNIDALIVALGGNDMLRGIDPAVSRANLDGILQAAAARGLPVLLVGMRAPGNYGPAYKAAFDSIYPDLARTYDALLYPVFFSALTGDGNGRALQQDFMQNDGIHPNARGVAAIVDDLGPSVIELINQLD